MAGPEIYSRPWRHDQVETALAFLRQCRKKSAPTRSSYFLKHVAENWGLSAGMCSYVGNGPMIAAAVALGFVVEPIKDTPNAMIGINKLDVDQLAKQAHEFRVKLWSVPISTERQGASVSTGTQARRVKTAPKWDPPPETPPRPKLTKRGPARWTIDGEEGGQ